MLQITTKIIFLNHRVLTFLFPQKSLTSCLYLKVEIQVCSQVWKERREGRPSLFSWTKSPLLLSATLVPVILQSFLSKDTQHHFTHLCLSSCSSSGQCSVCFSPYNPFVFQRSVLPTLWTSSCLAPPPPHGWNSPTCSVGPQWHQLSCIIVLQSCRKEKIFGQSKQQ